MLSAEYYFGNFRWSKKQKVFTFHLREKCPFCKKSFTNANRLKSHIIASHQLQSKDVENRKYKCSICPKSFKLKHHLKEHMNIHTGAKPYKCQNCQRSFSHSGSLSAHLSNKKCQKEENKLKLKENTNEIKNKVYFETVSPQRKVTSAAANKTDRPTSKNRKTRSSSENQFVFELGNDCGSKNVHKLNIKQERGYENYISENKCQRMNTFKETSNKDNEKQKAKRERVIGLQRRSFSLCSYNSKKSMESHEKSANNSRNSDENKKNQELKQETKTLKLAESYKPSKFIGSINFESFNKGNKEYFTGNNDSVKQNGMFSSLFIDGSKKIEPKEGDFSAKHEGLFKLNKNSNNNSLNPQSGSLNFSSKLDSTNKNLSKNLGALFGQQLPKQTPSHSQNSAFQSFTPTNLQQNSQNNRNSFLKPVHFQTSQFNTANQQLPFMNNFQFNLPTMNQFQPANPISPTLRNFSIASCAKEILENQTKMLHLNVPGPSSSFLESYNFWYQMIIANECARVLKTQSVFHNMNSPLQNPFAFNIHRNQAAPFPVSSLGSTASSQGSFVNSAISPNVAGFSKNLNTTMTECNSNFPIPEKDKNGMFKCSLCSKSIKTWTSFKRHIDDHKGIRRHECPHCDKKFKHKHHLTEHIRLHTGEKPFQCRKCGKSFSHSGSYSQHMSSKYPNCSPQDNLKRKAQKRKYTEAPVDLSTSKPDQKKICLQKNY